MKDISIYFNPVQVDAELTEDSLGTSMKVHDEAGFPEIEKDGIALIYVPEYRNSDLPQKSNDSFRKELYRLFKGDGWNKNFYDLGTIQPGERIEDTYFAVAQVTSELMKNDVIPVVIGGGQDLTLACYRGFESMEQMINICAIDSGLDIGSPDEALHSDGFVSHLLMQRPCYLFNYATIGVQRPLIARRELDLFDKLYFDVCRLGAYNGNYRLAEPYLRNSDLISIDFNSIKCAEVDNTFYTNPNGFYIEQMCQLAKYAGVSDKTSCLGVFNVHPDQNDLAANAIAQIVWYFMDGVAQRVGDFPVGSKKNYVKFHVHMDDFKDDLVFYKSDKSGRWWLEVKYPANDCLLYTSDAADD